MLTREEVLKIAKLAKIRLTEEEIVKYQKDLSAILDYAVQLQEINTNNVDPLYQVTGLEHVVREDIPAPQQEILMEQLVKASPQGQEENQFLVKNVL